ncbi:hypothetical protein ASF79_12970 [Agreia sp. Leaf335]|uniref:hypothetical protein n=1 Tax=Agreia sp. Leaf335 TaxID=1736340 RepID=UPI0006F3A9AC|nr:hypothetical protein [Agreia sp. Leaf335]KQR20419.1 hypothetical protein ASF79_12970 [Agreia sp. Leaf335]
MTADQPITADQPVTVDHAASTAALMRLEGWARHVRMEPGWQRVNVDGVPALSMSVEEPHSAILAIPDDAWSLTLVTSRGTRRTFLGQSDAELPEILDALMFALYLRATTELDDQDRAASVSFSWLLKRLASELNEDRYAGRAATLLAGHAIKDGYRLQAGSRLNEAIDLFDSAGDSTAADTARTALANLPELMRSHEERLT